MWDRWRIVLNGCAEVYTTLFDRGEPLGSPFKTVSHPCLAHVWRTVALPSPSRWCFPPTASSVFSPCWRTPRSPRPSRVAARACVRAWGKRPGWRFFERRCFSNGGATLGTLTFAPRGIQRHGCLTLSHSSSSTVPVLRRARRRARGCLTAFKKMSFARSRASQSKRTVGCLPMGPRFAPSAKASRFPQLHRSPR